MMVLIAIWGLIVQIEFSSNGRVELWSPNYLI